MLWVRVVCDLVMLVIATITAERYPRASCICGVLCAGWMLLEVIWVAGGSGGQYTPGLMLLFLGMPVLLPLTAMQAAGIVAVLVAGLGVVTLAASGCGEWACVSFGIGVSARRGSGERRSVCPSRPHALRRLPPAPRDREGARRAEGAGRRQVRASPRTSTTSCGRR